MNNPDETQPEVEYRWQECPSCHDSPYAYFCPACRAEGGWLVLIEKDKEDLNEEGNLNTA